MSILQKGYSDDNACMSSQNMMASLYPQIENKILSAVDSVVQQMAATFDEIGGAVIGRTTSPYLSINSSFLYRDRQSSTTQSHRRLVIKLSATGKRVRADEISVADDLSFNNHYKLLIPKDNQLMPLAAAIGDELVSIGDLLFILVGTIKGLRPHIQTVESLAVKEIRLVPSQSPPDIQHLSTGIYGIRRIIALEELLAYIDQNVREGLSGEDRRAIADAYESLLDSATTEVTVPSGRVSNRKETVLGQIATALQNQTTEYRAALLALDQAPEDSKVFHEILRIAYNFSTDVLPLISLFRSICDLKPLVFWCTLKQQWALHRAFASLPWSALGRKEKLQEYQAIIAQARNYAFHHVLPFDSTVEIDLSTLDVRADTIRLFLPFGKTQGRGVHLKDQRLADVLSEFSRAKLRPVSNVFWQANLKVMEEASQLAEHILETLLLLHEARLH
jgi:hypothetical protein